MAQPTGFIRNPLSTNPFWERDLAEPPIEWSNWAAIVKMAVLAKDGIQVRNLLRDKPELVDTHESILEVEIPEETDAQKKQRTKKSRKTRGMGEQMPKRPRERRLA